MLDNYVGLVYIYFFSFKIDAHDLVIQIINKNSLKEKNALYIYFFLCGNMTTRILL